MQELLVKKLEAALFVNPHTNPNPNSLSLSEAALVVADDQKGSAGEEGTTKEAPY